MSDRTRPEEGTPVESTATAVAEGETKNTKLKQTVEMRDTGPCRKHIKVTVHRETIDNRLNEKYSELMLDSNVSGFRPGKAPRKLVEKRFQKEVSQQVKNEILFASLEQLAEEQDVAPLTSPNINPHAIELPADGPLVYEFEVEVRPDFDLPEYKGLKLRRPIYTFTEEDIDREERRLLRSDGQVVPKDKPVVADGDVVIAEISFQHEGKEVGNAKESPFQVETQLAFRDGVAKKFAEQMRGAKPGDVRKVDVEMSESTTVPALRGKTIEAQFTVKDVKTLRLPEMTPEYLAGYGVHSREMLREMIMAILKRRLEYTQRQAAREQVIQKIAASSTWELPQELLRSQASKALGRRRIEMQSDGLPEEEINRRIRMLQQDVLQSTALSLKEHFVLQKIAEKEKIDIQEADVQNEIERLAHQQGISPRRFRAQLEREEMLDSLMAEMYERAALDLILDSAEYEEYSLSESVQAPDVSAVETQAVPNPAPEEPGSESSKPASTK